MAAIVALALVAPASATATVEPRVANLDASSLSEFSQTNESTGTLATAPIGGGYGGGGFAKATYSGGGANGYARGIFNVNWNEGDDVWYGGAYYLPTGFKAAMQGQVGLMRWDNWASHPTDTDHGGIVIYGGDKRARLVREQLGGSSQDALVGPFDLPEGRWFWIEVHQRFSPNAGSALSEVYLDGNLVGRSTDWNMYAGRGIERVRYGIVAIAAGSQMNQLNLQFDRATVSRTMTGPLPGLEAPAPTSGTSTGSTSTGSTTTTTSSPTGRKKKHSTARSAGYLRCVSSSRVRKAHSAAKRRALRASARRCRAKNRRTRIRIRRAAAAARAANHTV